MNSSQLALVQQQIDLLTQINNELIYMQSCHAVHFLYMQNTRFESRPEYFKRYKSLMIHDLEEEKKAVIAKLQELGVNYDGK